MRTIIQTSKLRRALRLFGLEQEAQRLRSLVGAADDDLASERLLSAFRRLVRKRYRLLARMWHPDLGGDPQVMQLINAQYLILSRISVSRKREAGAVHIVVLVCHKMPPERDSRSSRSSRSSRGSRGAHTIKTN